VTRVLLAIVVAAFGISTSFRGLWFLAFPVVVIAGAVFGLPLLFLARKLGWLAWWQAMIIGGLCAVPLVEFYLSGNAAHTERAGLQNSVYALGMGLFGGLIVWGLGIFRNPLFTAVDMAFPKSAVLSVPILIASFLYHDTLTPQQVPGRITSYTPADNPTDFAHAYITILTEEGITVRKLVTKRYPDPEIVGQCAVVLKKKNASLSRFDYVLDTVNEGCENFDPSREGVVGSDDNGG